MESRSSASTEEDKDDRSQRVKRSTSSANILTAPMPSSSTSVDAELNLASNRKIQCRGNAKKHKWAVPDPDELQPRKHRAESVNLNQPPSRTKKASQAKFAAAKHTEKKLRASLKQPVFSNERKASFACREELMTPVRAFGDRVGYL